MKKCLFIAVFILLALISFCWGSKIEGKVLDGETGEPLPGVNIVVEEYKIGDASDLDGIYRIDGVPAGNHTLVASRIGYAGIMVTDVVVKEGNTSRLDLSITPEALTHNVITVTAKKIRSSVEGLLNGQKKAATINSGISSEQISAGGDSKASDALKRVTGITIDSDKYVFVRGLNERYSTAQLNRSSLPSPEPDKRAVPFDIFPSGLLDNVVVAKSFSPNLPGDFSGGCIQLTTKDFPESFNVRFDASMGYSSQTTFNKFSVYEGGAYDFLGFGKGFRDLPDLVKQASEDQKIVPGGMFGGGFSSSELETLGESFRNIWTPYDIKAPLNQSYSLSVGNNTNLFKRPFGYVASLTYKNSYSFREEERFYYIKGPNGLEARHHYEDYQISEFHVLWGGIFNTSLKVSPLHKLNWRTTYTRSADDEVQSYGMFPNRDHNLDEISTRLSWVERSLLSTGISGEHLLSSDNMELDWKANYSLAQRYEPDTRETLFESRVGENEYRLADESNSGSRFFSSLIDHNGDFGADLKVPFRQWFSLPSNFQTGINLEYKNRKIDSRRFRYKPQDFNDVNIYQEPEAIFSPENIGPDGFQLEEDTRSTDNYRAAQTLVASYLMADMPLLRNLRFVGGARYEFSYQKVFTFDLFNPDADPVIGEVNNHDILPAVNLNYSLTEDMNLRAGFSQTVSRPSFRELSNLEFTDIGGHAVVGNPDLKRALIQNYDMRWEWYPGLAQNISLAVFYKHFTNPIEKTLLNATEVTSSWQNAKNAYAYRIELELRQGLGVITHLFSDFTLSGNLALIRSRVRLQEGGRETTTDRPLQGQAPYVLNTMLEYSNQKYGTNLSLAFNITGRLISEVGIAGTPDIYEESVPHLDFTLSQALLGKAKLKFSAKNLLDPEVEFTQGDALQRHYKKGLSFSLGLSYSIY
ncbi:TonB-dependent receptor [bacterium]|nr:TonB-dependent receptor [bacterium]